jgi:hypothetical protein
LSPLHGPVVALNAQVSLSALRENAKFGAAAEFVTALSFTRWSIAR